MKSLSLHSSGRSALAVSSRDSVLWDLDTFSRLRTLNGGQDVGVQDVSGGVCESVCVVCVCVCVCGVPEMSHACTCI